MKPFSTIDKGNNDLETFAIGSRNWWTSWPSSSVWRPIPGRLQSEEISAAAAKKGFLTGLVRCVDDCSSSSWSTKTSLKLPERAEEIILQYALMIGMASMILNCDLYCYDYYNDSLTDVNNPWFLTKTILNLIFLMYLQKKYSRRGWFKI